MLTFTVPSVGTSALSGSLESDKAVGPVTVTVFSCPIEPAGMGIVPDSGVASSSSVMLIPRKEKLKDSGVVGPFAEPTTVFAAIRFTFSR